MTPATPAGLVEQPSGVLKMCPPAPQSVGRARSLVAEFVVACGLPELTDTAELVVSELVTNAVRHAYPPHGRLIATRFERLAAGVRIEVHDASEVKPERQEASAYAESGRGLALVDALTGGRWGVGDRDGPGKLVWAHIEVRDAGEAKPERDASTCAGFGWGPALVDASSGGQWGAGDLAQPGEVVLAVCGEAGTGVVR